MAAALATHARRERSLDADELILMSEGGAVSFELTRPPPVVRAASPKATSAAGRSDRASGSIATLAKLHEGC